ncbi:FtsX-like permease family protein [Nostoc ellipsosporum NOK]|nr:FtsX-like permease family protein [Nostoc ellipsosporum NOK]
MKWRTPLAWLQMSRKTSRLVVAMAGIAFADMLMFMQLGFQRALYDSNTRLHRSLRADIVLISPHARNISEMASIPRRRLYQAMSFEEVASAEPLYTDFVDWKNPQTQLKTSILLIGFNPNKSVFDIAGVTQNLDQLKLPDTLLFDQGSRGNYTTTITALQQGKIVSTEIRDRKIQVAGLFLSGASFAADGNVITSDLNFLRILPNRSFSEISAGLITLKPGNDPQQVATALRTNLPNDVKVLNFDEFAKFEETYWANNTPIGFIFSLGTGIGFVVGLVIVYQILSADVADHTADYATLKAIGYPDIYLIKVVFQEALILAILGYIPGFAISFGLYALTRSATNLPLYITLNRGALVFLFTVIMCFISGVIAMRKLRATDPAELFHK